MAVTKKPLTAKQLWAKYTDEVRKSKIIHDKRCAAAAEKYQKGMARLEAIAQRKDKRK